MPKRVVTGIVTRDKAAKTRRVEVTRLVRHPRYGKILRRRTVCTAHDEENQSHAGDLVEIEESRPLSRTQALEAAARGGEGPGGCHCRRGSDAAVARGRGWQGRLGGLAEKLSDTVEQRRQPKRPGNPRPNGTMIP